MLSPSLRKRSRGSYCTWLAQEPVNRSRQVSSQAQPASRKPMRSPENLSRTPRVVSHGPQIPRHVEDRRLSRPVGQRRDGSVQRGQAQVHGLQIAQRRQAIVAVGVELHRGVADVLQHDGNQGPGPLQGQAYSKVSTRVSSGMIGAGGWSAVRGGDDAEAAWMGFGGVRIWYRAEWRCAWAEAGWRGRARGARWGDQRRCGFRIVSRACCVRAAK